MSHDHEHQHDANDYYLEQLCSIGFGGLLAAVVCMWYFTEDRGKPVMLRFMAGSLMPVVLAGGLALLALIVFRAVVVWRAAGQPQLSVDHGHGHAHGHEHEHGPECQHDHSHGIAPAPSVGLTTKPDVDHGHSHSHGIAPAPAIAGIGPATAPHGHGHGHGGPGHDHEHAWAPWRYMIMLVPIILGFLGLPAQGLQTYPETGGDEGSESSKRQYSPNQVKRIFSMLAQPSGYAPLFAAPFTDPDSVVMKGDYVEKSFKELEEMTLTPEQRERYTGTAVQVIGQFSGDSDRFFSLTRFKINCCGADAIPLNAKIVIDYSQYKDGPRLDPQKMLKRWVRVRGIVQFRDRGNGNFIVVIVVTPTRDEKESLAELVKPLPAPADPYVN